MTLFRSLGFLGNAWNHTVRGSSLHGNFYFHRPNCSPHHPPPPYLKKKKFKLSSPFLSNPSPSVSFPPSYSAPIFSPLPLPPVSFPLQQCSQAPFLLWHRLLLSSWQRPLPLVSSSFFSTLPPLLGMCSSSTDSLPPPLPPPSLSPFPTPLPSPPPFHRRPVSSPPQQCPLVPRLLPASSPAPLPSLFLAPSPSSGLLFLSQNPSFIPRHVLFEHRLSPGTPPARHRPSSAPSATLPCDTVQPKRIEQRTFVRSCLAERRANKQDRTEALRSVLLGRTVPEGKGVLGPMSKSRGGAPGESMCRRVKGGF